MQTTVAITSFRNNIKQYFDYAEQTPLAVHRHNKVYVLMTKEHYVDLINKTKYPNLMEMPQNVQTIVHFTAVAKTNP